VLNTQAIELVRQWIANELPMVLQRSNLPPTISLLFPTSELSIAPGQVLRLKGGAADSDGAVAWFRFMVDDEPLRELTAPPFEIPWFAAEPGTYTIVAEATDDRGAEVRTAPVVIRVDSTVPELNLRLVGVTQLEGGVLRLVVSDAAYVAAAEVSRDLVSWRELEMLRFMGNEVEVADPGWNLNVTRFYRFRVRL
jgi:hypothetical protein